VGDRNSPQTLEITTDEAASRDGGFAVQVHNPGRLGLGSYKMEFRPPCLVR
jgi:hypothetical protein